MDPGSFEDRYLELFFRRQRRQWKRYACRGDCDLGRLDAQLYTLFDSARDMSLPPGRRGQVLGHIIEGGLVDQHPEVARLSNRIDSAHLLAGDVSRGQLTSDVLQLMRLRDRLARERGHTSYVDLVLGIGDFDRRELRGLAEGYLEHNLGTAVDLVRRYRLTWDEWSPGLRRIAAAPGGTGDLVDRFLQTLGYCGQIEPPGVLVRDQPISGFVGVLSVPDDVRILIRPVDSLRGAMVLLHELGHAVAHRFNRARGIFKTWTPLHDEVTAVLVERIAVGVLMEEECRQTAKKLSLLESVRTATSFLFELDLWESPAEAEDLYSGHYGRLGIEVSDPGAWAADTFRSLDPVYIHSFVVGEMVAVRVLDHLWRQFGRDFLMWGQWLRRSFFADGRKRSLREKAAPLMKW